MSEVNISIVSADTFASDGRSALVEECGCYGLSETITSAATPAETTDTVGTAGAVVSDGSVGAKRLIWRIANMGADDIYVAFGTTPDATVSTATTATTARKGVPAGTVCYFGVGAFGDKVSVINV